MKIILEELKDGWYIFLDVPQDLNRVLMDKTTNQPKDTLINLIKADILAGKDTTGHAKYRKILNHHGILTDWDTDQWRDKVQVQEKDLPDIGMISGG